MRCGRNGVCATRRTARDSFLPGKPLLSFLRTNRAVTVCYTRHGVPFKEGVMAGRREIYDQALRQGSTSAWDQKWDQAIASYQKALAEFPNDPVAMDHLALAYTQCGQMDLALGTYQELIRNDSQNPLFHEKVADLLERRGRIPEAVQMRMSAAELFLTRHEATKAIDNWLTAAQLVPEDMRVRSKLALAYERTGQKRQAVVEYIALAAILQRNRQTDQAAQALEQGMRLIPDAPELTRARSALKSGKLLAVPAPYKPGGTGLLTPPPELAPATKSTAKRAAETRSANPLDAAQKKALGLLAERLFGNDKDDPADRRASLDQLSRGEEKVAHARADQNRFLAQGIDAYSRNAKGEARESFQHAMKAGLDHPALHFLIGALLFEAGDIPHAIPELQVASEHTELAAGAHFALGRSLRQSGQPYRAAIQFLTALRIVDLGTVPEDQQEFLQRQYETFVEVPEAEQDAEKWDETSQRIEALLSSPEWEGRIKLARAQLDAQSDTPGSAPLAEMLALGKPQALIEAMGLLENAFRRNQLRTAMELAMLALDQGPTYLPLHQRIAEIQLRDGRQEEALAKLVIIARAYRVRGEGQQAAKVLEHILQLNPMDIPSRNELIQLYGQQGNLRGALSLYIDLADVYISLADLDGARQTYESALMMAVQNNADRAWQIQLLYRLGDLYSQRLDYRAALTTFQRILQFDSGDENAAGRVVELMLRLGKANDARLVVDGLTREKTRLGRQDQAITWLEDLVRQKPEDATLRRKLAELYQQRGRIAEAIAQLDALADSQVEARELPEAIQTIRMILALNPPNAAGYQQVLNKLEAGSI
jgi:tetratricopeptide (TPR) repeat protein